MAEHESSGGAVRELLAIFGFGVDTKELKEGESKLDSFLDHVKEIGEGIAGAFAVEKIYEWAETQIRAITEIEHASAKLGISAEKIQEFQYAAGQATIASEDFLDALGKLQVNQAKGAEGAKEQSEAFAKLHVQLKEGGKLKDVDQLYGDVAESISKISEPAKQAELAVAVFGKTGRNMLPILKQGREGVEKLRAEFRELGGGYTERAIRASKSLDTQITKNALSMKSLRGVIFEQLAPATEWILSGIMSLTNWFRKFVDNTEAVTATLAVLGAAAAAFAIRFALANLPIIVMVVAIGLLIGVVDDLIVLFKGGKSVIGDVLDALFGQGASTALVKELRDTWAEIVEDFDRIMKHLPSLNAATYGLRKLLGASTTVRDGQYQDTPEDAPRTATGEKVNYKNFHFVRNKKGQQVAAEIAPEDYAPPGRVYGASTPRPAAVDAQGKAIEIHSPVTINVDGTGHNTKELAAEVGRQVSEHRQRANVTAARSLQRVNPQGKGG